MKILFTCLILLNAVCVNSQILTKGFIIMPNKDTVYCSIVKLKNKKEDEKSNYKQIEIVDSLGAKRQLSPKDILGYRKGDVIYKSANFYGDDIFMKLLVEGSAMLYYYSSGPDDERYIFKRKLEKDYGVMNSDTSFDTLVGFNGGAQGSRTAAIIIVHREKAFISYFSEYFKDCSSVVNKIKSGFYTREDMTEIFKEYNAKMN